MTGDLDNPFALYPMVEEDRATGAVAGVYAELLTGMPFVPSLFKSLALCPGYLVLAHEQAESVLGTDAFARAARELGSSVRDASRPPKEDDVREALAGFVEPLGRMLLLSAGLLLGLRGELDAPPAPGRAPEPREVTPEGPVPSAWDAPAPRLYGEIRAALETPIVNSIWRQLADAGQLRAAWDVLGPQAAATRAAADGLQTRALVAAGRVGWGVVASPAALERAGVADAAPGMAAVLDAYLKTLPRALTLVSSAAR
ncbi:MAG: hypothetical protein M3P95_12990 [Actinomycetota bacterium]|nr:hypothetical protein [Actinomycetota bacterium]